MVFYMDIEVKIYIKTVSIQKYCEYRNIWICAKLVRLSTWAQCRFLFQFRFKLLRLAYNYFHFSFLFCFEYR